MDRTNIQIPTPKNWQDFERLCADLWQAIWNDPDTQLNGRGGQAQHGVDVYGRPNAIGDLHGVQCKGKNGNYGQAVTEKELKSEVKKAKKFEPAIVHFILATTAPNDANIQKVARIVTVEHEREGLFPVYVWGWDEIERRLAAYPEVLSIHYPGLAYPVSPIDVEYSGRVLSDSLPQATADLLYEKLAPHFTSVTDGGSSESSEEKLNDKIDQIGKRLKDEPTAVLALLEDMLESHPSSSPQLRYRILANIGGAYLEMGTVDKAAEYFFQAGRLIPDEARGLSRIALGHLMRGDYELALEKAQRSVEVDPEHAIGYSALVAAASEVRGLDGIEDLIPRELRGNVDVAFNLGQAFLRKGEPTKAVEWAKKAYELEPGSRECRGGYGEALLAQSYSELKDNSGEIPAAVKMDLETARTILAEVWEEVRGKELAPKYGLMAANLAQIYNILKEQESAEHVLRQVIDVLPNSVGARKLASEISYSAGRLTEALADLNYIPKGQDIEADLMRVEVTSKLGKYDDALDLLDEIEIPADNELGQISAKVIRLSIVTEMGNPENALEIVDSWLDTDPSNISFLVEKADIQIQMGNQRKAIETISIASKLLDHGAYPYIVLRVASTMYRLKMYSDAAKNYKKIIQFTSDTPHLRNYLSCIYHTGQRKTFFDVVQKLPEDVINEGFYKRLIGYFYLEIGELGKARETFEDYLENNNDSLPVRLAWLQVLQRQVDDDEIIKYCSTSPTYEDAATHDIMRLVHIIAKYGDRDHALNTAYKVSRLNPRDLHALRGYCSLSLTGGFSGGVFNSPDIIKTDTSFSIEDSEGNGRDYTIEYSWPETLSDDQILDNHPIARAALGKKVGEFFTLKGAVQETTWTIKQIENKYARWHRRVSQNLQRYFPVESGFEMVNIKKSGEEYDFTPILKSLDQRRSEAEEIVEQYKTNFMPVALFALLTGVDALSAWIGLQNQAEIFCCGGSEREMAQGFRIIDKDNSKYIIDPLTLYTLFSLGIQNEVFAALDGFGIVQSSIDLFVSKSLEADTHYKQGHLSSAGDGTYIFSEESLDDIQDKIEFYNNIISWINKNCTIIAAIGDQPMVEGWETFKERMEPWFIDTMLAASSSDRVLFTEDFRYRLFANSLFGINGIWIQLALGKAVDKEIIDYEKYSILLGDLILANHTLIGISSNDLVNILENDGWKESDRFHAAAKYLQKDSLDVQKVLLFVAEFVQYLWAAGIPERGKYTGIMLSSLTDSRQRLMRFALKGMANLSAYIPQYRLSEYFHVLESWGVGHFLFSPGQFKEFLDTNKPK